MPLGWEVVGGPSCSGRGGIFGCWRRDCCFEFQCIGLRLEMVVVHFIPPGCWGWGPRWVGRARWYLS